MILLPPWPGQSAAGVEPHPSDHRDRHVTSPVHGGFDRIMGTKSWESRCAGSRHRSVAVAAPSVACYPFDSAQGPLDSARGLSLSNGLRHLSNAHFHVAIATQNWPSVRLASRRLVAVAALGYYRSTAHTFATILLRRHVVTVLAPFASDFPSLPPPFPFSLPTRRRVDSQEKRKLDENWSMESQAVFSSKIGAGRTAS